MAPPSPKTETSHFIRATDLWLSHLTSRAAIPVPLSPRSFFHDLEPIIEAHCIVIAGGIPLDLSTTFTPDKDARRRVHADRYLRASNGGPVLLEDCSMTIIERFRYLRNLKDVLEIGGVVAVYLIMQCHHPLELCLLDFSVLQFDHWWTRRQDTIPEEVQLHAQDRAQRYAIERLINEAVPRPARRRCTTSEFCYRVSRNVAHFKAGVANDQQITKIEALADGYMRLLTDILTRTNNKPVQDSFIFLAMLHHIFATGGERALLTCVLSVAPQDLWELEYRRGEFERCWREVDKAFESWQRLGELLEMSKKVQMLRVKLLELVERYPEVPYRPSIRQRIREGKFRSVG